MIALPATIMNVQQRALTVLAYRYGVLGNSQQKCVPEFSTHI